MSPAIGHVFLVGGQLGLGGGVWNYFSVFLDLRFEGQKLGKELLEGGVSSSFLDGVGAVVAVEEVLESSRWAS
jgi:hypothetical protein